MNISKQKFLENIKKLDAMYTFNILKYKASTRAKPRKKYLNLLKIRNISGTKSVSNNRMQNLLLNLAISEALITASTMDHNAHTVSGYINTFYDSIAFNTNELILQSNSGLTQEILSKSKTNRRLRSKISTDIQNDVLLNYVLKESKKLQAHAENTSKQYQDPWLLKEVSKYVGKNLKTLNKYNVSINKKAQAQKARQEKNTSKNIFGVIAAGVSQAKVAISDAVGSFDIQQKFHDIVQSVHFQKAKCAVLTISFAAVSLITMQKLQSFEKSCRDISNGNSDSTTSWQKVSNVTVEQTATPKDTLTYEDSLRIMLEKQANRFKQPVQKTVVKKNINPAVDSVKTISNTISSASKNVLSKWVNEANLKSVIKELQKQGFSEKEAYDYGRTAALCGSKTTDNNPLLINGKVVNSNGNHRLFGVRSLKDAGLSTEDRDKIASSIDFVNGKVKTISLKLKKDANKLQNLLNKNGGLKKLSAKDIKKLAQRGR